MSIVFSGRTQEAYEHISNTGLYNLLDELATQQVISINSAIQPYSRKQMAQWLNEAVRQADKLSPVMKSRVEIYLKEFDIESLPANSLPDSGLFKNSPLKIKILPPALTFTDKNFSMKFRPVYGLRLIAPTGTNAFIHSYGGAAFTAYFKGGWSLYANVRDNYISAEPLSLPTYFTDEPGGNHKRSVQGRIGSEYSEMRGGITYSWQWGTLGLMKDHLRWGIAAKNTNIFSGRTPSFPMIKLVIKPVSWLTLDYFHGWLVSEITDSTRSYFTPDGVYRTVFRPKYIAANMVTVKPFKNLCLSAGNSIVYSDVPVQPAYLIPLMFYKSIDHTLNHNVENQNSAMFASLSSRQIKHLHLYANVFVDELSLSRFGDKNRHNFISYKPGITLTDWPLINTSLTFEFTHTNPLTFKHRIPSTTFENNCFNLGHYLRDNSREFYTVARWYPSATLMLEARHLYAYHGNEYAYDKSSEPVDQLPILKDKTWSARQLSLMVTYQPEASFRAYLEITKSHVKGYNADGKSAADYMNLYGPSYLHGDKFILQAGFNLSY